MHPTEIKFYKKFWNDDVCRDIFLSHKSKLLKIRTLDLEIIKQDYFSSEIIISNTISREESIRKIESRVDSNEIDIRHNLKLSVRRYFNEEQIQEFLNKKYGRTIQKFKQEINEKSIFSLAIKVVVASQSEEGIVNLANEYHITPSEAKNVKEIENYFVKQLKTEGNKFLKRENISELFFSIDDISKIYDSKLRDIILKSDKHYTKVFYKEKWAPKNRMKLFEELFELGILKYGKSKSYYECVNCPPNTFSGLFNTNIPPGKLKLNCPSCNEETFFAVPFSICKEIYEHITHQDGLLFHAIKYLVHSFSIRHEVDKIIPKDIQIDICILNNQSEIIEIIEIKMFKRDRPKDTKIGNLKDAFEQIEKMRTKLIKQHQGFGHIKYSIVSNIGDDEVINETKKKIGKKLREINTEIYSPEGYRNYLKNIS